MLNLFKVKLFYAIIVWNFLVMNKKGYTTESGGRQNGFAIEPEIIPITEGEYKKSIFLFIGILLPFLIGGIYYFKTLWLSIFINHCCNLFFRNINILRGILEIIDKLYFKRFLDHACILFWISLLLRGILFLVK